VTGPSADAVVEIAGLDFAWAGGASALIRIGSLRLARGERLFVRGPSGSGKSTLLNLLAGVVKPRSGTVRLLGTDIFSLGGAARDRFRADHVGYIFQMFNLIPYLSVVENVCLPCEFSSKRRSHASRAAAGVQAEALRLLAALDIAGAEMLRRPVTELSVGQQQRVAAARALIGAPELVIADEPTSSLDADRRQAFVELLFRQCEREGTTLVFASHDLALAPLFDRSIDISKVAA
jgi:putative ABC transport system ATP-binding protein